MAGRVENLRPAQPGNKLALTHGATSDDQIRPAARAQKRRLLRQNGLRARDLDGLGIALLDNWSRAQAKVELLDRYFDSAGFLDAKGNPRGGVAVYFTALNSAARTLTKLDAHIRARGGEHDLASALALLDAKDAP